MSANIPEHVTKDQRIANQLFGVSVLELEIIDLANERSALYDHGKASGVVFDTWFHDKKIQSKIKEMNQMTRNAIGPPPAPEIKAKQKFYMTKF